VSPGGLITAVAHCPPLRPRTHSTAPRSVHHLRLRLRPSPPSPPLDWRHDTLSSLQITVIREIPAYAGFYTGYELTKRYFSRHFTPDPVPIWALLCSGAVGGVSYWLACYPLDVVKSRIQLAKEPPTRGGWLRGGYVAKELATIVHEGGV
jgi:hypothetical protein